MLVELSKEDIISMVKGTYNKIGYGLLDYLSPVAKLTGFPNERLHWDNEALSKMSEEALYEMYDYIKKSK